MDCMTQDLEEPNLGLKLNLPAKAPSFGGKVQLKAAPQLGLSKFWSCLGDGARLSSPQVEAPKLPSVELSFHSAHGFFKCAIPWFG